MKIQLGVAGAAILLAGPGGLILNLLRLVHPSRAVGVERARVGLFSPSADLKLAAAGGCLARVI